MKSNRGKILYDRVYREIAGVVHNETPYVFQRRLDTVINLLNPIKKGIYLDVGCGDGRFERLLAGYKVVATEVSIEAIRNGKDAETYVACDGMQLPFKNSVFDGVICSEVIEHMPSKSDVKHILNEIVRVCKIGGDIVITTPNENSFVDVMKYLLTGRRDDYNGTHTALMSEGKLKWLLERLPAKVMYFERYFISVPVPRYEWALPKGIYKYMYFAGKLVPFFCFGFMIKARKLWEGEIRCQAD